VGQIDATHGRFTQRTCRFAPAQAGHAWSIGT